MVYILTSLQWHSTYMVLRLLTVIPNWLLFPLYYPVFLLEVAGKACRFCEIIRCESGSERLILMRDVWMVFVPYFSRYLFEVWIAPVKHFSDLTGLDDVSSFALVLRDILSSIRAFFGEFSYNYVFFYCVSKWYHFT